jgi:hypothetical protein
MWKTNDLTNNTVKNPTGHVACKNLSSELRLFSCAKKPYRCTFNLDTIFGTKEGVVYKPDENYLVHFLVQFAFNGPILVSYFALARIATNGCLGFPSHESGHLLPP